MAVYEHPSSKTHIQITSSAPNVSSDTRMMAESGGEGGGLRSFGASLPFSCVPVDGFPPSVSPTLLSVPSFCFCEFNHMLHKSKSSISAENIIKMVHITDARQTAGKGNVIKMSVALGVLKCYI